MVSLLKMKELKMPSVKEMLEDINASMSRARELSTSEDVTEKQRAFYKMVSKPLQLGSNCNTNAIINIVREAMIDAVSAILDSASDVLLPRCFNCVDASFTDTTTKGAFRITVHKIKNGTANNEVINEMIEIPRAIKHTKALALIIETTINLVKNNKELAECFDFNHECFKEAWVQYRVKLMANEIKANTGSLWMYFTDNNYYEHYKALSDTQNLHSCMAYRPEYYGSQINGKYIHPLQGYDYAPDFRLGLVSTYSPDEINDVTEYPFIARAVVSYSDHSTPKLMYGKSYGNEKACTLIRNCLYNGRPTDRLFYAIKANHLDDNLKNADDCDFNLRDYYNDGRTDNDDKCYNKEDDDILGHFVAPFIDPWANLFDHGGRVYRHPITGLEVINCMVIDNDEWYDEDEDRTVYNEGYCIYHGTGIVRPKDDWDDTYSALIVTFDGLQHL